MVRWADVLRMICFILYGEMMFRMVVKYPA